MKQDPFCSKAVTHAATHCCITLLLLLDKVRFQRKKKKKREGATEAGTRKEGTTNRDLRTNKPSKLLEKTEGSECNQNN